MMIYYLNFITHQNPLDYQFLLIIHPYDFKFYIKLFILLIVIYQLNKFKFIFLLIHLIFQYQLILLNLHNLIQIIQYFWRFLVKFS